MHALAEQLHRDLQAIPAFLCRPLDAEIARGNLTGPQQSAMAVLVRCGPMSLKDLGGQLGPAHSTTSGIVDRLQKRGMISRETNTTDRRLTRLAVTREVEQWIKRTMPELGVAPLLKALRRANGGLELSDYGTLPVSGTTDVGQPACVNPICSIFRRANQEHSDFWTAIPFRHSLRAGFRFRRSCGGGLSPCSYRSFARLHENIVRGSAPRGYSPAIAAH